jgi:kynurenine formamidase
VGKGSVDGENLMRLIDLTQTIRPDLPVFPGDEMAQLKQVKTIDRDGYTNFRLSSEMHVGTHIDGPLHMISDGIMIPELPLEQFAGAGVLIDVRGEKQIELRESFRTKITSESIVLFYSGLDKSFGKPEYFTAHPELSDELALYLAEQKVKMVGIDWPSPDHHPYPIHKILLKNNILILENLTNLDQLLHETNFEVFAFPLKVEADSSLVRAMARVDLHY